MENWAGPEFLKFQPTPCLCLPTVHWLNVISKIQPIYLSYIPCFLSFIMPYISGKSIQVIIGLVSVLNSTYYSLLSPNCRFSWVLRYWGSLGEHSWRHLRLYWFEVRRFEADGWSVLLTIRYVLPQVTLWWLNQAPWGLQRVTAALSWLSQDLGERV